MWWQKLLLYGHIGLLLEFWFTGLRSLFKRHWKLTSSSYLWMLPVYGVTALLLEVVGQSVPWPFYYKAFLYVPIIYGSEALAGANLKGITGLLQKYLGGLQGDVVPWEYEKSNWAPFGLINLRYAPIWYFVALGFDPLSTWIRKLLTAAAAL